MCGIFITFAAMIADRTITMLGTGNALATRCYNTCFVLQDGDVQN